MCRTLKEIFKHARSYSENEYMTDARAESDTARRQAANHLEDIADGCGCVEFWEHLSERRASD
jgi:hypothetical protein